MKTNDVFHLGPFFVWKSVDYCVFGLKRGHDYVALYAWKIENRLPRARWGRIQLLNIDRRFVE